MKHYIVCTNLSTGSITTSDGYLLKPVADAICKELNRMFGKTHTHVVVTK